MHNRIRPYAWGSRTAIAELLGAPSPSPHPQAELWVGAHPADSSTLVDERGERSLADLIAQDPIGMLGEP
ncbi:MAG TPA: type I phosphomannose isomerase catalytic subunit, partial [Nakamurella sp.]|nr:type I phosphomannose isomerase catalytic subunit [Nakamurella sp.]